MDSVEWLRFMAEHAAFAAHLMDPIEAQRIRSALETVGRLTQLQNACTLPLVEHVYEFPTRSNAHAGVQMCMCVCDRYRAMQARLRVVAARAPAKKNTRRACDPHPPFNSPASSAPVLTRMFE